MRRTPLKRKTPIRSKSCLQTKTALKSKTPLKSSSSLASKQHTNRKQSNGAAASSSTPKNKLKKTGLTGIGTNKAEKAHHAALVNQGCFVCNKLKLQPRSRLCVHHTDGRKQSKDDEVVEYLTLCLCQEHHDPTQMTLDALGLPSPHGNKKLFRQMIGSEPWCVLDSFRQIGKIPHWLTTDAWDEFLALPNQCAQEIWIVEKGKPLMGL